MLMKSGAIKKIVHRSIDFSFGVNFSILKKSSLMCDYYHDVMESINENKMRLLKNQGDT